MLLFFVTTKRTIFPTRMRSPIYEDGDEDEDEVEEDEVREADEELRGKCYGPDVQYDKDDHPMTVGSTYPNMGIFKLALSQHAIKHEFEYNTEKSAPYRYRAYFPRKKKYKCPWRLHASTMEDRSTVMVFVLLI
jgi:hypothetical protein